MLLSITAPIFNEASSLHELCDRIRKVCEKEKIAYEIILVDNGSTDDTLNILAEIKKNEENLHYISLSRNFGHQGGLWAGLCHSKGNAVITMDGDLQHPPEFISELIQKWKEGYKVVNAVKSEDTDHRTWKVKLSYLFYKLANRITEVSLKPGQSDFRIIDRQVVDIVCSLDEKNKFMRGLVSWVGFNQADLYYQPELRKAGSSKFRLWHYINFAMDGIFSFSVFPLRTMLWTGIVISIITFLYAFIIIFLGFINIFIDAGHLLPPGWATIAVSISFLGGIQLLGMGVLGEYIARVYLQTKSRPDYIVKQKQAK